MEDISLEQKKKKPLGGLFSPHVEWEFVHKPKELLNIWIKFDGRFYNVYKIKQWYREAVVVTHTLQKARGAEEFFLFQGQRMILNWTTAGRGGFPESGCSPGRDFLEQEGWRSSCRRQGSHSRRHNHCCRVGLSVWELQLLVIPAAAGGTCRGFPKLLSIIQGKQSALNRLWIQLRAWGELQRAFPVNRSFVQLTVPGEHTSEHLCASPKNTTDPSQKQEINCSWSWIILLFHHGPVGSAGFGVWDEIMPSSILGVLSTGIL